MTVKEKYNLSAEEFDSLFAAANQIKIEAETYFKEYRMPLPVRRAWGKWRHFPAKLSRQQCIYAMSDMGFYQLVFSPNANYYIYPIHINRMMDKDQLLMQVTELDQIRKKAGRPRTRKKAVELE